MEYGFADRVMARAAESERKLRQKYGKERADKISQRLAQMRSVDSLAELMPLPGKWHQLTGDRYGQFATALDGPYRLIFEPDKPELDDDGEIDLATVCNVVILEIVDYH